MGDSSAQPKRGGSQKEKAEYTSDSIISSHWEEFRLQLMLQWAQITPEDLDKSGPNRHRIALLIERKYGIASELVENYLGNFERTMPLAAKKMNYAISIV